MPNHVHLIAVPSDKDGLRETFADAHRRYTAYINARLRTSGHLWQGRFGSVASNRGRTQCRYVSYLRRSTCANFYGARGAT